MEDWLYMMFIEKTKTYNKLTKAAVERHVANLRSLDEQGHLALAGVFKGYPGVAGMYILKAESYEAPVPALGSFLFTGSIKKRFHLAVFKIPDLTAGDIQTVSDE